MLLCFGDNTCCAELRGGVFAEAAAVNGAAGEEKYPSLAACGVEDDEMALH